MPVEIRKEEVRQLIEEGAQLVDVLSAKQYEEIHLSGAINIPMKELDREHTGRLQKNSPIIVYCYDYQ